MLKPIKWSPYADDDFAKLLDILKTDGIKRFA